MTISLYSKISYRLTKYLQTLLSNILSKTLHESAKQQLIAEWSRKDIRLAIEAIGPLLNRHPDLDNMSFDLPH